MTDQPEDMGPQIDAGTVVPFPIAEFIETGGLHMANREWFWPKGLTLVASQWRDEGEVYRTAIQPLIRAAFDEPVARAAILDWADAVNGSEVDTYKADRAAEMIFSAMAAQMRFTAAEGLFLRQYDPPEVIRSGLTEEEQTKRQQAFGTWLADRYEAIIP